MTSHAKTFLTVCRFRADSVSVERLGSGYPFKKNCHPFERPGLSVRKKNRHPFELPACRRLLFPLCNKGNRRRLHAGNRSNGLGYPFEKIVIRSNSSGYPFEKELSTVRATKAICSNSSKINFSRVSTPKPFLS